MSREPYHIWCVYAPNGNHTSLPANTMHATATRLASHMLNTDWADLETLGFTVKRVLVTELEAEEKPYSAGFSDAKP